VLNHKFTT